MLVDLYIVLGMLLKFSSQKSDPPVQLRSSSFSGYLDAVLLMCIDFQMMGDVRGLSKDFLFFFFLFFALSLNILFKFPIIQFCLPY